MIESGNSIGQTVLNAISQRTQQNFKLTDANKSGGLDIEEVQTQASRTGQGQKILDNFESIDTDGNGELTQTELRTFRQENSGGRNPEELLNQLKNIFGQSGINTGSIVDFLSNQQAQKNELASLLQSSTKIDGLIESRVKEILTLQGETPGAGDLISQFSTTI